MKNAIYKNKKLLYAIVFALVFCTVFFAVQDVVLVANASSGLNFDNTNVLDDLSSSTTNGKPFDFLEYPFNENGSLQIINFVEYCYSYKANMRGNYGLYIYVYNPQGIDIVENSGQNKIQMAVSWSKNSDGEYVADRYEKFNLKFCNKSEKTNYKGLYYKFKVVDKKIDGKTMAERVNSMERRYDVSGVELLTKGNQNATEYGVSNSYRFSGFAEGYGDSDKSTLSCTIKELETLSLDVHHTYYRTNVSSLGKGHYNEVNTVYFSIPDRIYKANGKLQMIHAEWWEYKTKKALITSSEDYYNKAIVHNKTTLIPSGEYWTPNSNLGFSAGYGGTNDYRPGSQSYYYYEWGFNIGNYSYKQNDVKFGHFTEENATILPLVFYAPVEDVDDVLSFFYTSPVAGDVSSDVVSDYIYNYTNDDYDYIDCNGRAISSALFEDKVDDGRTMGYNNQYIDLADTFDLNSYDSNHNWWDKFLDYGFSLPKTDGDYSNVSPIYELSDEDFSKNNDSFSDELLVAKDDVNVLRNYYKQEKKKGNHVVLFRFANTDYFCREGLKDYYYIAQQTCFFDFDIIDLTFNKDGVYTVIPVVSSPIDIINDFTAPPGGIDWLKLLALILALILLVVLLAPILPYILNAIVWVVSLPFKIIGRINKSFKNYRDKRKHKDDGVTQEDVEEKSKKYKTKTKTNTSRVKNVEKKE